MSISSDVSRVDYVGNGTADEFAYPFRILESSDLRVVVRNTDDVETVLTLTTDYTVTGVGEEAGGAITLVDGALTTDYVLSIRRVRPVTQETDIRNQGVFFPEIHEDALDHGIMVAQQHQEEIDRSVKLPESVDPDDFDPTLPSDIQDQGGKTIVVNSAGDGLELVSQGAAHDDDIVLAAGKGIRLTSPDGTQVTLLNLGNDGVVEFTPQ